MRTTIFAVIVALGVFPLLAHAESAYDAVQHGNTLYQEQQYEEAARQYATAAEQLPGKAEIQFNQGNAAYKQQDYADALNYFTQALNTADPMLESRTKYNLGNVKYQQALQAMANPKDAIPHVQSAMTYYRDSLDADPQQPEARYNLELAYRLLRQLQQQQQQQQTQNQDNPKQAPQDQQKDDQDDQKQQQNQQEQNQQEARQKESSQDSQNQQTGPSDQDQTESPTDPEQNESQPPPQQAQELTPEEAERLLETIRERAQEADRARQQRRRAQLRGTRVDKDW